MLFSKKEIKKNAQIEFNVKDPLLVEETSNSLVLKSTVGYRNGILQFSPNHSHVIACLLKRRRSPDQGLLIGYVRGSNYVDDFFQIRILRYDLLSLG